MAAAELDPEPRPAGVPVHSAGVENKPRKLPASQSNFQNQSSQMGLEQKGEKRGPIPPSHPGKMRVSRTLKKIVKQRAEGRLGLVVTQIRPSSHGWGQEAECTLSPSILLASPPVCGIHGLGLIVELTKYR